MPSNALEAVDILEALESGLAYIPGGRDREGRSVIVVDVPPELQPTTKPRLESLISYYLTIFSEETKKNGLVLIVDARRGAWRVARSCIRLSTMLLGSIAAFVIIVRPDGFWDKRVDSCTKSHKDGEPIYVTLSRLQAYVDFSQLPYELGGNKSYHHTEWIQKRVNVEDYKKDALELISKMANLQQRLNILDGIRMRQSDDDLESYWEAGLELTATARRVLHSGRSLVSSMSRDCSKDSCDTVQRIHGLLDSIEIKQVDIENSWTEMERNLDTARVVDDLEQGVSSVTDWILGPADAMLNACCKVGFDVTSSEELRRQHEKLELQCRDTYAHYAELLHKIDSLPDGRLPEDLKSQRDFMDFVCRSFASRLERRRNVLITSQRFFRLVSEYFDRTSEVFDKLVMANKTQDFSQAGAKLHKLERNQSVLEALERELMKEGEKLSDILSMPVKDALGRDVRVDYGEDIVNVRDILDATNARKNIFNDSVELQKLSLKQIALIDMYEGDAKQAVKWLMDLLEVLLENHMEVGCNANEIQSQKEEHQSFQETAKGTYDYGCQLVNGARVLRLSCRLSLESNASLFSRLRQAWRQLRSVSQEQLTRLRVCAVFHRSVDDHCSKLRNLIEIVGSLKRATKAEDRASDSRVRAEIRDILGDREKLLLEVGRMVRLGRLLRSRLKETLCHQRMSEAEDAGSVKGGNLTAVDAISARLAEVTRLAEKLDARLCEAGARTRPMPISPSVLTSTLHGTTIGPVTTTTTTITTTGTACVALVTTVSTTATTTSARATSPVSTSTLPRFPLLSSFESAPTLTSVGESIAFPSASDDAPLAAPASGIISPAAPTFSLVSSVTSTSGISGMISTGNNLPTTNTISSTTAFAASPVSTIDSTMEISSKEIIVSNGTTEEDSLGSPLLRVRSPLLEEVQGKEAILRKIASCNEENLERMREESAAEDSNVESYMTATECSTTPTARSRSESFGTIPECEDVTIPVSIPSPTRVCPIRWPVSEYASIAKTTSVSSVSAKRSEEPRIATVETKDFAKPEVSRLRTIEIMDEGVPSERFYSEQKIIEDQGGKIVKEVTETTTIRVSHDTRLGVASYKVISNTLQNRHQHFDIKEAQDHERFVEPQNKMNGFARKDEDLDSISKHVHHMDECTKNVEQYQEDRSKSTNVHEVVREKNIDAGLPFGDHREEISLSLKEFSRQHEDSGIEMSPTKKEDYEGECFLEKAGKVSAVEASASSAGEEGSTIGCNLTCGHCYNANSRSGFTEVTAAALANENCHRTTLSNPS